MLSEIFGLKVSLFACVSSLLLTLSQTHTSFHCSSSHLTPGIKDVKFHKEYNKWAFLMGLTVHAERRLTLNTPALDLYYEYTQHAYSLEIFLGGLWFYGKACRGESITGVFTDKHGRMIFSLFIISS